MTTLTELPGDPDTVETKARHYLNIADAIKEASASLKRIAEPDSTISKAVDSVKDKAGEVAEKIEKAEHRYRETSSALITYAAALKDAQGRAHAAIVAAGNADDGGHALAQKQHYETLAAQPGPDQAANQKQLTHWTQQVESQQHATGSAQSDWQAAHDDKNTAANTAADKIDDSLAHGDLNDTWWDNFSDWASGVLSVIKAICEVAAFLSIFLSWVPFLGEALLILAVVGAVLTLVDTINKMAHGEAGWGDLILASVGLVLTVFGGKIFSYLGKFAKMRGISTAMRQGGPIRELTGLGSGNSLRLAAREFRAAKPFENPFKMEHDLSWLTSGSMSSKLSGLGEHVLGISEGNFITKFDSSLFSSGKMKAAAAGIGFFEVNSVAGKVQGLVNAGRPEDEKIHISLGG